MRDELKLENIRSNLIRQEETIIFSLIERAQYSLNEIIYRYNGISIPGFNGSFMMYLLSETEKIHARVRRYTAPDEHAFTANLPEPYMAQKVYEWPIKKTKINMNYEIMNIYLKNIISMICENNDDGNYGSSSVCDINVLQALSKRIHYGKFIAESKYLNDKKRYKKLILKNDKKGIMDKLTNKEVENKLLERVKLKTSNYGQEPNAINPVFKIQPDIIKEIYSKYIIPLTKEVEYEYLIMRLN